MDEIPIIEPGQSIALISEMTFHTTRKFRVRQEGVLHEAFLILYNGRYYAYRNQCRHAGTPLDWTPNQFFDETGDYLLCRTHGAIYQPDTGECAGGPCAGKRLHPIDVAVESGRIILK
jgi:nitrite reductase/ring-hydroxylating ferredoxin subunit